MSFWTNLASETMPPGAKVNKLGQTENGLSQRPITVKRVKTQRHRYSLGEVVYPPRTVRQRGRMVPTPPSTRPIMRSIASKNVKSCPATKPLSRHHIGPASDPSDALIAKFMVLATGRFTPYTAAPASLSRIASTARRSTPQVIGNHEQSNAQHQDDDPVTVCGTAARLQRRGAIPRTLAL